MELIQVKGDRFLVKSLEPTMKGKEHWLGWFQMETEARMKEIKWGRYVGKTMCVKKRKFDYCRLDWFWVGGKREVGWVWWGQNPVASKRSWSRNGSCKRYVEAGSSESIWEYKMIKSYNLTEDQNKKVEKAIKVSKEKYEGLENIVMESEFDAGVFFEHELDDDELENNCE
jgi:hypothetical protein